MDQSENIIREKEKQSDLVCKMSCHGKKKISLSHYFGPLFFTS